MNASADTRRLRYRLRRQGLAELDAWLGPLHAALDSGDSRVIQAVSDLLECDANALLAIMRGEEPMPAMLRPWLAMSR